jgi:DNA-binding NarL/FixJ family response regulator
MDTIPHERLLQMLSGLLIQVNALQTIVDKASLADNPILSTMHDGLMTIEQMTREVLSLVRATSDDLPIAELEGITLAEALSRSVEETAEMLSLSSRVSFSGVDDQGKPKEHELSRAAERVIFLIAREALYEVQQHTGARKLRLVLSYGKDNVQMSIEDDGLYIGPQLIASNEPISDTRAPTSSTASIPTETTNTGQPGVSIIHDLRYRIEQLGGSLEIAALGERGTRVLARVPYILHVHSSLEEQSASPLTAVVGHASTTPNSPIKAIEHIRVLVVDSQAVTRAGLRRLLDSYTDLQVIGDAADSVQAVSEALELGPQVVLLDSHLPNGQSMEALRQLKQLNLEIRVLLLSTQDREEYLYEALRAGADGYVLKDIAPDELAEAVRVVARGEMLVQPQLAGRLLSRFGRQGRGAAPYESLTTRELEVLRLLARGLRNKEIAARLFVSERTVNFHLANIYQKLNVSGRTEALSRALEQGLITA